MTYYRALDAIITAAATRFQPASASFRRSRKMLPAPPLMSRARKTAPASTFKMRYHCRRGLTARRRKFLLHEQFRARLFDAILRAPCTSCVEGAMASHLRHEHLHTASPDCDHYFAQRDISLCAMLLCALSSPSKNKASRPARLILPAHAAAIERHLPLRHTLQAALRAPMPFSACVRRVLLPSLFDDDDDASAITTTGAGRDAERARSAGQHTRTGASSASLLGPLLMSSPHCALASI